MIRLEFDWCIIEVNKELRMSGIPFTLINNSDGEGNNIPEDDQVKQYYELDNHQAYELAMELLKSIDVRDTRGSK